MAADESSDLMTKMNKAIKDALKVREGEVLTPGIIEERAANITMTVFAVLPPIHSIRVTTSDDDSPAWRAAPTMESPLRGVSGVGFTSREAVVDFFRDLFWDGWGKKEEGPQLYEIDVDRLP